MAFSIISRNLLRTSRELLERNMAGGVISVLNNDINVSTYKIHT